MPRYTRVLGLFWSTSLAAEMEYRFNFVIAAITSLGTMAGSLFGLSLFYSNGYHPGGWSWNEALLVVALFTLLEGFTATLLTPNLGRVVRQVQLGTLDFVLLKPIDSQFWLSTRNFSPWGLPNVVLGFALLGYAGARLHLAPLQYLYGVIPILLGMVVLYSLWFILGATSIWFVKINNVTEVLRSFLQAGLYPISAYPVAYQIFFTFVVPVAFLTTVPAEAMLSRASPGRLVGAAVAALTLALISRWFWRFALRFYTSASS
jgi:ABC-2 type transport system permease protein